MLPYLEVAHLPSSSSYYSAFIQPLGLRYLSTEDGHFPTITFGDSFRATPVFQIQQVTESRERPLKLSHITLLALSVEAVDGAYESALRANPNTRESSRRHLSVSQPATNRASAKRFISKEGKTRVVVCDFDGNTMEIVYRPPPEYPSHHGGSTVRHTQSTNDEAARILGWNFDIASSEMASAAGPGSSYSKADRTSSRRGYGGHAGDEPFATLRRSVTAGSTVYESTASPRQSQNPSGLSTTTVVGTLLAGAAIGSAITYGLVRHDRLRTPRQEFDAPAFTRRSTFPEPYAERKDRFIEADRSVDRMRHQIDYTPIVERRASPEYIASYSHAGSRSREAEDFYDDSRGRHSASRSRPGSVRTRSEAGSHRQPLLLAEAEHRSHAGSRSPRHPPIVQRSYTYEAPERERDSYGSSKSQRSSSTIRAPPMLPGQSSQIVSRSRSGARVATTTVKVGHSPGPRALSRSGTYTSARNVPLPASGVGGRGEWEDDDDDLASLAPSDSISCVGSRRSGGRSHR
ncbi:hypothetical protein B0H67DRAFT_480236 [Lasiosphaeris hirsuta]|uniref:Glyoxalase family protein n=1 Tax=Lasiosphaeris hirsuta TaxID=260670 RepID=A0AA40AZA3_9PEZI|nr:hypothetical protein B0H67DRAFT_480236 [Lasiosphaeris hirsuta]